MTSRKLPILLCLAAIAAALAVVGFAQSATEAPAAFATPNFHDARQAHGNGFTDDTTFAANQVTFMEADDIEQGLGPTFNSDSCASCHATPQVGGTSQLAELRVGHTVNGNFVNPNLTINDGATTIPGRSLVNQRSICENAQALVPGTENIHALRATLNVLGDGFIEAIDSNDINAIAQAQPGQDGGTIVGQFIQVPVAEALPGQPQNRGARFGWKNQQASLLSFSSDAYLNEQGISNRFAPTDVTTVCKTTADPEDTANDIDAFAAFMRATQAPPRDTAVANSADGRAGATLFNQIGCNICHVQTFTTVPTGTAINGGAFIVPAALGNKTFHPFSDFLLHNVGTGDGIVQNGGQTTANKLRTPPLWGLRTHFALMHDLQSFTRNDAILRHAGEAVNVINRYRALSTNQKNQLVTFLNSL